MRTKQAHRRTQMARIVDGVRTLPGFNHYPVLYVSSAVRGRRQRADFADLRTFLLFVGHPRSGHSFVGSLLDAHPRVLVSHELDALKYVGLGYRRFQLFALVAERSRSNAAAGRKSWGYSYAVPGQWQGRYEHLQVIGDKRGRQSTARLAKDLGLLDRLGATVQLPVAVLQVVRDPFDNISTMFRRGQHTLAAQVDEYFSLCETVAAVEAIVPTSRFHRVRLEDLIADPAAHVADLCRFLDVEPTPDYLQACTSIVFDAPHRTRSDAPWTPELRNEVRTRAAQHPWLASYVDDR